MRRRRSLFEPPEEEGETPDLIPLGLWKKIQKADIIQRGQSIALHQDAADITFNMHVEAGREMLSGIGGPRDVERIVEPPKMTPQSLLRFGETKAIAEMRRDRLFKHGAYPGVTRFDGPTLFPAGYQRETGFPTVTAWAPPDMGGDDTNAFERAVGGVGDFLGGMADAVSTAFGVVNGELSMLEGSEEIDRNLSRATSGLTISARESADFLARVSLTDEVIRTAAQGLGAAGPAFDGRRFIKHLTVHNTAFWDSLIRDRSLQDSHRIADKRFDELWEDLHPAAQGFIEALSPGHMSLAVAGGPVSRVLLASGTRGGMILGRLLEPLGSTPLRSIGLEAGASAAARYGYEETDGLPLPLRIAVGAGGAIAVAKSGSMPSRIGDFVRTAWKTHPQDLEGTSSHAGTVLSGAWVPRLLPRPGRPAGDRLIPIPDVLAVPRPESARGVTDQITLETRQSRAGQLNSALARAADYAAQHADAQRRTVPPAIAHHIQSAEADWDSLGKGTHPGVRAGVDWLNGAPADPVVRQAILAAEHARAETLARIHSSNVGFLDWMRQAFHDTRDLPERIQYVGLPEREIADGSGGVKRVPAAEHPLTGTIIDFVTHPRNYDASPAEVDAVISRFREFDFRNSSASTLLDLEFGVDIGDFDTGIQAAGPGGVGIFFPTVDRASSRVARGAETPSQTAQSGRLRTRTFATAEDRLADPVEGAGFDPELDIENLFFALDRAKANTAARETMRYALGGSLNRVPGWKEVPSLADEGRPVYLPAEQAESIEAWLTSQRLDVWPLNTITELKNTKFGADAGFLTIQGSLGWLASPLDSTFEVAQGLLRGAGERNLLRPFTELAMARDMAAAPERWARFYAWFGVAPQGGTPAEFRTEWLRKLPVIGKPVGDLNDGAMRAVLRAAEGEFNEQSARFLALGSPVEEAYAMATVNVKRMYSMQETARLGLNAKRASLERLPVISPTFMRQPLAFTTDASMGLLKLAAAPIPGKPAWASLSPREAQATMTFAKMAGSMIGLSVFTGLATADERGLTPEEVFERSVLDIDGPEWLSVWLGSDIRVPLGGPLRGLMRAVVPRRVNVSEDREALVPFAGLLDYLRGRVTVAADIGLSLEANEDFLGRPIQTESGFPGLLQSLGWIATNALPIALGSPVEEIQHGSAPWLALTRSVAEFMGTNPNFVSEYERLERGRRRGAMALFDLPVEEKLALGMTEAQVQAGKDARTLAQLRRAVGNRAANYLAGLTSPDTAANEQAYFEDLRRRADLGDREAAALVVQLDVQERLAGLAEAVSFEGVVDGVEYRNRRSGIVIEGVGQSRAFGDVFEEFGRSESEVDRDSADWYALFDLATERQLVGDREVLLGVDYDAFQQLEDAYFARIGAERAALVEANVATAPRGANPAEVELRAVRRDLEAGGRWQVDDDAWALAKPVAADWYAGFPEDFQKTAEQAANESQSMVEFKQAILVPYARFLIDEMGEDPATAVQWAKALVERSDFSQAYSETRSTHLKLWMIDHIEDGLAERALQWGYLDNDYADEIFRLTQAFQEEQAEAEAAEGEASEPRSAEATADDLNASLVKDFTEGLSFGQLEIKHGLTRAAVIGRLRRASGGKSPSQVLRTAPSEPAQAGGADTPAPSSAQPADDLDTLLVSGFVSGLSFGQLATKHGLERHQVIYRLRKAAGGSPTQLREGSDQEASA